MMLTARNVNGAFRDALWRLRVSGVTEESRNGPVISMPEPTTICYLNPRERVLWNPQRDANPFFHLLEALWMLAGRDDSGYVSQFNSGMVNYAEPDGRIHGAYGMRWRHAYGFDQLESIIGHLKRDPTSRRAVLSMWYAYADLDQNYKDIPCNTHAYFRIFNNALDMTVCNRSNDLLWGAFGANAVHFSILQEFIANALGVPVGRYFQFTNNLHLYVNVEMAKAFLDSPPLHTLDRYEEASSFDPPGCITTPDKWEEFLVEVRWLLDRDYASLTEPFLLDIAMPMQEFYLTRKAGREDPEILHGMPDCDWKYAALDWVNRRNLKAQDALDLPGLYPPRRAG